MQSGHVHAQWHQQSIHMVLFVRFPLVLTPSVIMQRFTAFNSWRQHSHQQCTRSIAMKCSLM